MNTDYHKYTSKELLEDDYFIQSMIYPTPESDAFWNSLLSDGMLDFNEYHQANNFILLMQRPKKLMTIKEKSDLWVNIEIINKKNLRKSIRRERFHLWGAVACLFAVISVLSFFIFKQTSGDSSSDFREVMTAFSGDVEESKEIQLVLADKTIELEEKSVDIELNKDGEILVNSKQMAEPVAIENKKEEAISFNQLLVPMGRHSRLILPDGTKMHVNAGSKVIFPNRFDDKKREIFVNGEVYLDVARNEKSPFFVRTENMNVRVLGTRFNVRAYEQDDNHSVVLVSGSVGIQTKDNNETHLSPDQMLDYSGGKSSVIAVNSADYISWIEGYFIYKKEPLSRIMKQISRYYGIPIEYSSEISHITCSGKLDLKEDMDKVMNDLAELLPVKINKVNDTYIIN